MKQRLSGKRRAYATTMKILMGIAAGMTAALVLFLIIYVLSKGLRRWTKGYTIKQPNMDCQPTEITALMRHRAVFS